MCVVCVIVCLSVCVCGGGGGVGGVGGDILVKEEVDHLALVELSGIMKGCLLVHVQNVDDVKPGINQGLCDWEESMAGSKVKGGDLFVLCCVDISTIQQQDMDYLIVTTLAGKVERGVVLVILGSHELSPLLKTVLKNQLHDVLVALGARKMKRRLFLVILGEQVNIVTFHLLQEFLNNVLIAKETGLVERRILVVVMNVDLDVGSCKKNLDCRLVPTRASQVKRRDAILVLTVDVNTAILYEKLDGSP